MTYWSTGKHATHTATEASLATMYSIGCGYGYGTVSVIGNATGTVPYL